MPYNLPSNPDLPGFVTGPGRPGLPGVSPTGGGTGKRPAGGVQPPPGMDFSQIADFVGQPGANFQQLLDMLTGTGKADLEAYIRELFGDNGGTIAQALAAGQLTPDQAVAMLIQGGMSPEQAAYMVQQGLTNIPLLTMPGQIASRLSARGGGRALIGPGSIERTMASQEVVRRAQAIQSEALRSLLQFGSRGGGGGGGGSHGGGGEPGPRPALPPVPIPSDNRPPWWAAGLADLAKGGFGLLGQWLMKDKDPSKSDPGMAAAARGNLEFYNRNFPKYESYWNARPQPEFNTAAPATGGQYADWNVSDYGSGPGGSYTYTPEQDYEYPTGDYGAGPQYDPGDFGGDYYELPDDTFTGWDDSWSDDNYYY